MYKLNLPEFDYKLKKAEGKVWIFDGIRKKFIVLTPEEWVRQHFVNYLITELKYPKALIRLEGGLKFNQLQKRSDIVVFSRDGSYWMIVECKSPLVKLSHDTIFQASMYNSSLKARFVTVSNGLSTFCSQILWDAKKTVLLDHLPVYQ